MKLSGIVVLAALCLSILTPLTVHTIGTFSGNSQQLVTLDVCHASDSSLSVNAGSPSLIESPCNPEPLTLCCYSVIADPLLTLSLIPSRQERPPQS